MCGIVGGIATGSKGLDSDSKIVRDLMTANTVRGFDGAGVFWANDKYLETPYYLKTTEHGSTLCDGCYIEWGNNVEGSRFFVGHNRAATLGNLDVESTHPFVQSNLIGVHNGTIQSWRSKFPGVKADMDSAALYEYLSKQDQTTEATLKVLSSIGSEAYALVWYDMVTKRLNFARNYHRPLWFARGYDMLWFASELPMLEWILGRHKRTVISTFELDTHKLVSIPVSGEGEIEVSEYKPDTNTYRGGWSTGSWKGGNHQSPWDDPWDDDYDYLNVPATTNTKWYRKYDNFIDILEPCALSGILGSAARARLYSALTNLMAAPPDAYNKIRRAFEKTEGDQHVTLSQLLGDRLSGYQDVQYDMVRRKVVMPFNVMWSDGKNWIHGYVQLGGRLYPASGWCGNYDMHQAISNSAKVISVSGLEIMGVRVYKDGNIGLVFQPQFINRVEAQGTTKIDPTSTTIDRFIDNHPAAASVPGTCKWDDWEFVGEETYDLVEVEE